MAARFVASALLVLACLAQPRVARATFTHDSNNRLAYGYTIQNCGCSEADRLTSIQTPDLVTPNLAWALDYSPEGRLKTITDPDGHATSLAYQATGELSQVTDANHHGASMTYDSLGRLSGAIDALQRSHTRAYPDQTSSGSSGTSIMSGGPDGAAVTTDFTAPLSSGQYQIGLNLFQQRGDPAQVSFYRDATFELSFGSSGTRPSDSRSVGIASAPRSRRPRSFPTAAPATTKRTSRTTCRVPTRSCPPSFRRLARARTRTAPTPRTPSTTTPKSAASSSASPGSSRPSPATQRAASRPTPASSSGATAAAAPTRSPSSAFSCNGPSTTYTYSPSNGRVTNFTDADGSHDVTYDTRGLVQAITVGSEGTYTFFYDEVGRNVEVDFAGSLVRTQQYDHEGRLTSRCYDGDSIERCYTATYDAAGNPTEMTDPDGWYTFEYDDLDRLSQSTRGIEVETYDYNALGALHTNAGLTLDDQRDKLAGGGTADAAVPASYDNVAITLDLGGRITSLFGNTLAYNGRGRLISITHPTQNNTTNAEYYAYDSQMRRIGRFGTVNGAASPDRLRVLRLGRRQPRREHRQDQRGPRQLAVRGGRPAAAHLHERPSVLLRAGISRGTSADSRRTDGSDGGGYRYGVRAGVCPRRAGAHARHRPAPSVEGAAVERLGAALRRASEVVEPAAWGVHECG